MASSADFKGPRPFFDVQPGETKRRISRLLPKFQRRRTVNLRPNVVKRYPLVSAVGLILIVLSVFGLNSIFTKAEVADFYPAICLGDWQNPSRAQGVPELLNSAFAADGYTADNSTIYAGGESKIYCGGFVAADYETKGTLTSVGLTLVWQVGDTPLPTGEIIIPAEVSSTSTSTSSEDASGTSSSSEAMPSKLEPLTSFLFSPGHFLGYAIPRARAQEADMEVAPSPVDAAPPVVPPMGPEETTPVPASESVTEPSSESVPVPDDQPFVADETIMLGPPIGAALTTSTVEDELPASTSTLPTSTDALTPPPVEPDAHFLKISYSLDGQSWYSLGLVNEQNWQRLTITVPVTNWQDLKRLQISVEGIPTNVAKLPKVYLDGLLIEAHYKLPPLFGGEERQTLDPGEMPFIELSEAHRPLPVSKTSNEFSANETPVFDIDLEGLPLPVRVGASSVASSSPSSTENTPAPPPQQDAPALSPSQKPNKGTPPAPTVEKESPAPSGAETPSTTVPTEASPEKDPFMEALLPKISPPTTP